MSDWTGSSSQRRAQGTCRPPATPAVPRYRIPCGTYCTVTRLNARRDWRGHKTRRELTSETTYAKHGGYLVFRVGNWLLRVHASRVSRPGHLIQRGLFDPVSARA